MRAYLADDDVEVRRALRVLLEQRFGFQVVGEAAHAYGLTSLVESARADLVMLDWELPGRVDAALLVAMHQLLPRPRIVVLSSFADLKDTALTAGADAFAGKGQPPEHLLAVLASYADC